MVSLGQGLIDEVTREVTEKVSKEITEKVIREVSEQKDKEFAATLEQIEREHEFELERERGRERDRERERVAMKLMASGMPVDKVAEFLELPVKVMQSLVAGHSTGACSPVR